MLFADPQLRKRSTLAIPPPTPETGWRPPRDFPNLSGAKVIGIDCEVKENDFERGPGWSRGKSNIVGISLAAWDGTSTSAWYFPVGHEVESNWNLGRERVLAYLRGVLVGDTPKCGANLTYDIGTLLSAGIAVNGPFYDCQFAEALLHEDGEVNLDHLGEKYCGTGKTTNQLYAWLRLAYGNPKYDQRENIWRASPRLVGPYAEQDAALPIEILVKQWPLLSAQGLLPVFEMECGLIPLIVQMRMEGVRVDIPGAERLYGELTPLIDAERLRLKEMSGVWANVNSGDDLAKVFRRLGLEFPMTARTQKPSFVKAWLEAHEHPVAKLVIHIRNMEKIQSTFLRSYLLEANIKGRVHGQFHLLRGDSDGTRSGRMSSSTPNLQNIPARSAIGKKIRQLYVPDLGHAAWHKADFSQIEYRALVHFAVGEGADAVREQYLCDPSTDYHKLTQRLVKEQAGVTIPRNAEEAAAGDGSFGTLTIKEINFGLLYGMGEGKLGKMAKLSEGMSSIVFKAYHAGNPYVKMTMDATAEEVQRLGYITTISGRRSWFNLWVPGGFHKQRSMPLPFDSAIAEYGTDIERASTHKAINRRLQGSAADILKRAMWKCWRTGVFQVIGVPRLTVHDETDLSVIDSSAQQKEGYAEMRRIMETSTPMRIPLKLDVAEGPNWGSCK